MTWRCVHECHVLPPLPQRLQAPWQRGYRLLTAVVNHARRINPVNVSSAKEACGRVSIPRSCSGSSSAQTI